MRVPQTTLESQGTTGTHKKRMTFDEESHIHLMSMYTNLYSNKEAAAIRETATNARDSHIAAGNPDPILVTTPTDLDPTYTVQDFGTGLSVEDIEEHFSKYGWSSKRGNDEETGMFGLGCKAPLAYVEQFTIVAVKDGLRTVALVARDEDGSNYVEVIEQAGQKSIPTDEPSGVALSFSVPNRYAFLNALNNFFRFWEPGMVLIDGEEPIPLPRALVLDEDVFFADGLDSDYVVQGGVPYPVSYEHRISDGFRRHVVAYVPVGSVSFPPPRESLLYDDRTVEVLSDAKEWIRDFVTRMAQADIDAQPTPQEGVKKAQEWQKVVADSYRYRGESIPSSIYVNDMYPPAWEWVSAADGGPTSKTAWVTTFQLVEDSTYVITGHDNKTFPSTNREKFMLHLEGLRKKNPDLKKPYRVYIVPDARKFAKWADPARVIDFDVVRNVSLPKTSSARPTRQKTGRAFHVTTKNSGRVLVENITSDDIVYFTKGDSLKDGQVLEALDRPGRSIVVVATGRVHTFLKRYPKAQHVEEALAKDMLAFDASLTDFDRMYIGSPWDFDSHNLRCLLPLRDELDDIDLKRMLRMMQKTEDRKVAVRREQERMTRLYTATTLTGTSIKVSTSREFRDKVHSITTKYPLLEYIGSTGKAQGKALIQYVNAIHAYTKDA